MLSNVRLRACLDSKTHYNFFSKGKGKYSRGSKTDSEEIMNSARHSRAKAKQARMQNNAGETNFTWVMNEIFRVRSNQRCEDVDAVFIANKRWGKIYFACLTEL